MGCVVMARAVMACVVKLHGEACVMGESGCPLAATGLHSA